MCFRSMWCVIILFSNRVIINCFSFVGARKVTYLTFLSALNVIALTFIASRLVHDVEHDLKIQYLRLLLIERTISTFAYKRDL